jgi:hypothetical protein
LITLLFSLEIFGQNSNLMHTVNASGNEITSNSTAVSYSIGQVFFSYNAVNEYHVAEGIHQGNMEENGSNEDIDVPDDLTGIDVTALIYPNPTKDFIMLNTQGFNLNTGLNSYQLYNYQGKLLNNSIIENTNTKINLSTLSSSVYILKVFANEKLLKTFKILKQ